VPVLAEKLQENRRVFTLFSQIAGGYLAEKCNFDAKTGAERAGKISTSNCAVLP